MPWSTSTRATRLPRDWHAQRARCYRDANGRCTNCGTPAPLHRTPTQPAGHADHVDRLLGDTSPLAWLCQPCHLTKSSVEGQQAMRDRRVTALHPREQHPGLR